MDKGRLVQDVKQAEGCRREAYKDTNGFWTAGYGHKLLDQTQDWTGNVFDQATIDAWLSNDLDAAMGQAMMLIEWAALDCDARQNAVVELVFNMGVGHWRLFALTRAAISHKQWKMAYDGLLNSLWAREVQPDGFDKPGRATRIASYILSGAF